MRSARQTSTTLGTRVSHQRLYDQDNLGNQTQKIKDDDRILIASIHGGLGKCVQHLPTHLVKVLFEVHSGEWPLPNLTGTISSNWKDSTGSQISL